MIVKERMSQPGTPKTGTPKSPMSREISKREIQVQIADLQDEFQVRVLAHLNNWHS